MSSKSQGGFPKAVLRHVVDRMTKRSRGKADAVPHWKFETLEPRLLMSADQVSGVHVIEGAIDQPGEQDRFEFIVAGHVVAG